MGRGRSYTEAEKEQAVELARTRGLAHAHRELGIPKGSIQTWLRAARVSLEPTNAVQVAAAVHKAVATVAQADRFMDFLESVQVQAATFVHTVAGVNREYAQAVAAASPDQLEVNVNPITGEEWARPDPVTAPELHALYVKVKALRQASLEVPHAIGAFTRATHDLRLLREQSTENTAIVVQSLVPRPGVVEGEVVVVEVDDV